MSSPFPRTTCQSLTFVAPFSLPGFDDPLPAGIYAVTIEEEAFEGTTHTVFRRVATTLAVHIGGRIEHHPVHPEALDIALRRDRDAGERLVETLSYEAATPPSPPRWRAIPQWLRGRSSSSPRGSDSPSP